MLQQAQMKYFFHLSYKGTRYRGWQRQATAHSLQAEIEAALAKMAKTHIPVIGCGRTDAGVHASQYVMHLSVEKQWDFDPVERLNKMLPNDISVYACMPVSDEAHAQYDATERMYSYFIHAHKDPFLAELSSYYPMKNLDISSMQEAVKLLNGDQDCRALCKKPDIYTHTRCNISHASLSVHVRGDRMRFCIRANRFLKGMVRIIVGNLLEIGRGRLSLQAFEAALNQQQPLRYFQSAYPQGLYLAKVTYPYLELPVMSEISALMNAGF